MERGENFKREVSLECFHVYVLTETSNVNKNTFLMNFYHERYPCKV